MKVIKLVAQRVWCMSNDQDAEVERDCQNIPTGVLGQLTKP